MPLTFGDSLREEFGLVMGLGRYELPAIATAVGGGGAKRRDGAISREADAAPTAAFNVSMELWNY